MTSLAGRTVLLTGATGTLGRAIAEAYCRAGARLVLSSKPGPAVQIMADDLSSRFSLDVPTLACDLSREDDIRHLAEETRRRFGGLDVLINTAAVIGPIGPLWENDWDEWKRAMDTNLLAVVHLCRLCVPFMPLGSGRGKIINSSGGGASSPRPRFSAYAAAKTSVVRFSETLALEVEGRRIDINCIAPGVLNSTLTRTVVNAGPERAGTKEYDVARDATDRDTDARDRAAALAVFLGSSQSDGISGRLLSAIWDDWESLHGDAPVLNSADTYTLRRVVPEEGTRPRTSVSVTPPETLKVAVAGLWHLGCVTAACLAAAGHAVVAYDGDPGAVTNLRAGNPAIAEPGLGELIRREVDRGRLRFEDNISEIGMADVTWITWDTPIDHSDQSDVEWVLGRIEQLFPHLRRDTIVLVSSQLPVGSIAEIERRFTSTRPECAVSFACVPENLRLGKALDGFTRPERIVCGVRDSAARPRIARLLAPFTDRIEWMSVESAEMTKHALNAFLATSIAFINEIASLCEYVGADAAEVSRGMKSDARIGPRAYLSPGSAFAGGTLARDLVSLAQLGAAHDRPLHLVGSVHASNDGHKRWATKRLHGEFGSVSGRTVALWGLTYKPGTSTLRRSSALELCEDLLAEGAVVRAYDPAVPELPAHLATRITLGRDAVDTARGADALVVTTEWPEFLRTAEELTRADQIPGVLDANGFLSATLDSVSHIRYITVGRP